MQIQQQRQAQLVSPLIFIGGAKGVGKTTLINNANRGLNIPILHTGSIYTQANNTGIDVDNFLYNTMLKFVGIIDSHYAGRKPDGGFKRGMQSGYLSELSNKRPELKFVLVTASLEDILIRKQKDNMTNIKQRDISREKTLEELEMSNNVFREYLRETGRKGLIINNSDNYQFESTTKLLDYIARG